MPPPRGRGSDHAPGIAVSAAGPHVTQIEQVSDHAFLVRLGETIDETTHARVVAALGALDRARPAWVVDLVPAYATILIIFDPLQTAAESVVAWIEQHVSRTAGETREVRRLRVPVWYDPEVGLDLEDLARELDITVDEVVSRHAAPEYLVFMLGFKPGFPYMGTLDERLVVPRLAAPRTAVSAGSVAIAGRQTGIYPVQSPGGWRILGRTPRALFDPMRAEPFLFRPGDRVRFEPIDRSRYLELGARQKSGEIES